MSSIENMINALLDDMGFVNIRLNCRLIELMMPKLMKMVESEMKEMGRYEMEVGRSW